MSKNNSDTSVKICGLTSVSAVDATIAAGADYMGLVFFPPSPRHIQIDQAAALAEHGASRLQRVGLFVNPDDALLSAVLNTIDLDMIQLQGSETPERAADIKAQFNKKCIKALPIATREDLRAIPPFEHCIDYFLFDAKPPKDADRPGGNGEAFDWSVLTDLSLNKPWMLAGGLTEDNVATAIRISAAPIVDTSSSVEDAPGVKSPAKIKRFVDAAKKADT